MTDLAITAANVVADSDADTERGKFGAPVAAGKLVYVDPDTKRAGLSDNNGAAVTKAVRGVALNGGANGQPGEWVLRGPVDLGAVAMTPGDTYYASATPGGICPKADLASGMRVIEVGYARTATELVVDINDTGVVL